MIITFKRVTLLLLTLLTVFQIGLSLYQSWNEPQIQNQLQLYQVNLLLKASNSAMLKQDNFQQLQSVLLGDNPLELAQKEYYKVLTSAENNLKILQDIPDQENNFNQLSILIDQLNLQLGIIKAIQDNKTEAIALWNEVKLDQFKPIAEVLTNLWNNSPKISTDTESLIKTNLMGWFQDEVLLKLYQENQFNGDQIRVIEEKREVSGDKALQNLLLLSGLPIIGFMMGTGILIWLVVQRFSQPQLSYLNRNANFGWEVRWDWEVIILVLIVGFFWLGRLLGSLMQIVLVQLLDKLSLDVALFGALSSLLIYGFVAISTLGVLYFCIRSFLPLGEDWFRINITGNWFWWGFGGYLVALPLVIMVSIINESLWQGQGGSNPILPIALEGKSPIAFVLFFITAAIAAPIFEELLFRGFLLTSLTRYIPLWGATIVSSLIFALVHLSVSEVIPLTTLGMVLGIVYTRSRDLLSSIWLHSLWNTGTLITLFLLNQNL